MSTSASGHQALAVSTVETQWEDINASVPQDINSTEMAALALILTSALPSNTTVNTCASTLLVHSSVSAHTALFKKVNNAWTRTNAWTHQESAEDVEFAETIQVVTTANVLVGTEWTKEEDALISMNAVADSAAAQEVARTYQDRSGVLADKDTDLTCMEEVAKTLMSAQGTLAPWDRAAQTLPVLTSVVVQVV